MKLTGFESTDRDMWRMSRVILREIEHAATWVDMVAACEALSVVRGRWASMKAEHEMLTRDDCGVNAVTKHKESVDD